jgi:hypothetical protein
MLCGQCNLVKLTGKNRRKVLVNEVSERSIPNEQGVVTPDSKKETRVYIVWKLVCANCASDLENHAVKSHVVGDAPVIVV